MINLVRTDSDNADFIALVKHLDADLAERDGSDHSFYSQFNKINKIKHAVVAYENDKPIACGAIKEFSPDAMEVKRMYTIPASRGKGVAGKVLTELEKLDLLHEQGDGMRSFVGVLLNAFILNYSMLFI